MVVAALLQLPGVKKNVKMERSGMKKYAKCGNYVVVMMMIVMMKLGSVSADVDVAASMAPPASGMGGGVVGGGEDSDVSGGVSSVPNEFFWFNEVSGESKWELPVIEHVDMESGNIFYFDTEVNEASWVRTRARKSKQKYCARYARVSVFK